MNQTPLIAAIAIGIGLAGCGSLERQDSVRLLAGQVVPAGSRVLVLQVPDGVERDAGVARGSGAALTAAFRDSLLAHGFPPQVATHGDLEKGLAEAGTAGIPYVLKVVPTEWEDNATQWSGKPDSATLSFELYLSSTKVMIGAGSYSLRSDKNATSNPSPNRFIPELADAGPAKLFGWSTVSRGTY